MPAQQFPPDYPVTLAGVVPSYLYQQYTDDDALQTFVDAQNFLTQKWVDDLNALNLPVYSALSGQLLDWVAHGLYGLTRPILSVPVSSTGGQGPYNTVDYRVLAYGEGNMTGLGGAAYVELNDDQFKRYITWHVYKGDGNQFTFRWLKRRIHRFLNGANGYLPVNDNTYDVSMTCSGTQITVLIADSVLAQILQYAVSDGVLGLPIQFGVTVSIQKKIVLFGTGGVRVAASTISILPPVWLSEIDGVATVTARAGVVSPQGTAVAIAGVASVGSDSILIYGPSPRINIGGVGAIISGYSYFWTTTLVWGQGLWEPHQFSPMIVMRAQPQVIGGRATITVTTS